MKIQLKKITIRELAEGYEDHVEEGVVAYGGRLDVRPPYQREFIYKDKQRDAVIDTVIKGFPLNTMYWAVRKDGDYEIIDGQQRTIAICEYVNNDFSLEVKGFRKGFSNLQDDEQKQILDYELTVYLCSGEDSERLEWFKTINIAGEKLSDQELRNAVYSGSWVTAAKKYFSKTGCPAHEIGHRHLAGSAIRQEYLETAIKWISEGKIEEYMAKHQHDSNAHELSDYFENVLGWVKEIFQYYRKEMKGRPWGFLYNEFKGRKFDPEKMEKEVEELMKDKEVTNKKGVYEYLLTGEEKHLNLRSFDDDQKREVYERQGGICTKCGGKFEFYEMEADHITPWHEGGKTIVENCQMLCRDDNRRKAGK